MTDQPDPYAPPPAGGQPPQPSPYAAQEQPPYATPGWGSPPGGNADHAFWGRRVGGYLLDALVLVPFYIVAAIGAGVGGGGGAVLVIVGYVGALIFGIWNTIFRQGRTGRSLGKEWVGITLLRESDRQPIGPGMTFVRAIAHILDALPIYIGFLWPLWDAKRQTFADKVCSTIVVRS